MCVKPLKKDFRRLVETSTDANGRVETLVDGHN